MNLSKFIPKLKEIHCAHQTRRGSCKYNDQNTPLHQEQDLCLFYVSLQTHGDILSLVVIYYIFMKNVDYIFLLFYSFVFYFVTFCVLCSMLHVVSPHSLFFIANCFFLTFIYKIIHIFHEDIIYYY